MSHSQNKRNRSINYVDRFGNPPGESDFQGSQEYRESQADNADRNDERITEDINEELTQDPELDASDVSKGRDEAIEHQLAHQRRRQTK